MLVFGDPSDALDPADPPAAAERPMASCEFAATSRTTSRTCPIFLPPLSYTSFPISALAVNCRASEFSSRRRIPLVAPKLLESEPPVVLEPAVPYVDEAVPGVLSGDDDVADELEGDVEDELAGELEGEAALCADRPTGRAAVATAMIRLRRFRFMAVTGLVEKFVTEKFRLENRTTRTGRGVVKYYNESGRIRHGAEDST